MPLREANGAACGRLTERSALFDLLAEPRKQFGHRCAKPAGNRLKAPERQILLSSLNGTHEVAMQAHLIGKGFLRIPATLSEPAHAQAEQFLKLVHPPLVSR